MRFKIFGIVVLCSVLCSTAVAMTSKTVLSATTLIPISVVIACIVTTASAVWFLAGQCSLIKNNVRRIADLEHGESISRMFEHNMEINIAKIMTRLKIED